SPQLGFAGDGRRDQKQSFDEYAEALRQKTLRKYSASPAKTQAGAKPTKKSSALIPKLSTVDGYPWKYRITTTVFWVGEQPTENNPVSNEQSAWDSAWFLKFGGYDDPDSGARKNFVPASFSPGQNPFYVALPYNDVDDHHTKPEAARVIPWFKDFFARDGKSVCKGRWIMIRHNAKVCFAQWEDVGPYRTDDWKYVFGNERPQPNENQDAGLDVSPAVRDYLGLSDMDLCDWKFVNFWSVQPGPWTLYGENNTFVLLRRFQPTPLARTRKRKFSTGVVRPF
ncbi:MAG: hypothetical protein JOY96_02935, partial [Verrucomicrobia bacterium]|nr:hypothetical protein [Verrucomicrobiota bacterium]